MATKERLRFCSVSVYTLAAFLLAVLTVFPAHATDYYWNGSTGSWGDPSQWNPYGLPQSDYSGNFGATYVTNTSDINASAYFTGTGYSGDAATVGQVKIYGTSVGTMTLSVSDGHLMSLGGLQIGTNGAIDQTGGSVSPRSGGLVVDSGGIYNLKAGSVSLLEDDTVVFGVFNHTGGIHQGTDAVDVRAGGVYNLSGTGEVSRDRVSVEGVLNQGGGTIETNKLFYSSFSVSGTYNLSGGSILTGNVINNGTINYSGGGLHSDSSSSITNNGITNLSGSGTRTVDGNVVNNGTFKVINTTAVYTGTFTNNGVYISDPASNHFKDLIVSDKGYLIGQRNDKFYISGNFINQSTMNTSWNTSHTYLDFVNSNAAHQFSLTGQDFGATMKGYANNFSWGTLDLTGSRLSLLDGNAQAGGALYVRDVLGLQISGDDILNISAVDGLDIYYMANLKDNWYLDGLTYDLVGSGHLIPVGGTAVPEPATLCLLCFGLVGLVGFARKAKG